MRRPRLSSPECLAHVGRLAVLLACMAAQPAHAALFDDDEARRQIKDLTTQTNERFETQSKAQFELANQIQALREENARLRGQVETLSYELDAAKKRQQDFYVDLDGRLRKLEPQPGAATDGSAAPAGDPAKPAEPAAKPVDPAAETRDYEAALNLFRGNKIKEAAGAFDAFLRAYPDSTLAPNAQYWLGNAQFTLRDCKKAVDSYRVVVTKWPQHPKAPDALVGIASCQQDTGDAKGAKATLETVLAKYPGTPAATTARQRLKK